MAGKIKGKKRKGKSKKLSRNLYWASGNYMRNKIRKIIRHLKKHPHDRNSYRALKALGGEI